jgi:hypothetical protein
MWPGCESTENVGGAQQRGRQRRERPWSRLGARRENEHRPRQNGITSSPTRLQRHLIGEIADHEPANETPR